MMPYPMTRELSRGVWTSVAIHAALLPVVLIVTHRSATFGRAMTSRGVALSRGAPMVAVGDLLPAPTHAASVSKTSPTGSVAVKTGKTSEADRKLAEKQRLDRIRKGLRKPAKTPETKPAPVQPTIDADALEDRLRGQISNPSVVGNLTGVDGTGPGGGGQGDTFMAAVITVLTDQWMQPTRVEIGDEEPTVTTSITVRADGTVTAFQLTKPSGVAAMDDSVERLLRKVRKLPPLGQYGLLQSVLTIEVTFVLDKPGSRGGT